MKPSSIGFFFYPQKGGRKNFQCVRLKLQVDTSEKYDEKKVINYGKR